MAIMGGMGDIMEGIMGGIIIRWGIMTDRLSLGTIMATMDIMVTMDIITGMDHIMIGILSSDPSS